VKKIKKSKIKNKGKPDFLFALWKGAFFHVQFEIKN
jgi:hypothetical protein